MAHELAKAVVEALVERNLKMATAETDTGGLIGSLITDVPGCSAAFLGGVVPYHGGPKVDVLGVPRDLLREYGSVSEEAALAMAMAARTAFGSDIAVSETGITGPTGGSAERPIGTVWLACVGPGERSVVERHVWDRDREGNKALSAERALEMVREAALADG